MMPDFGLFGGAGSSVDDSIWTGYSDILFSRSGDNLPPFNLAEENSYDQEYPLVDTNEHSIKPPGEWKDQQKLTVETFKEVVTTDVENVWVIAYVDPRCRDCVELSIEWDKLTMIEEKEKRKVKLGYVDLSVAENWKIIQDHTRGKKMTHTPEVAIYGDNKETPHIYPTDHPTHDGLHTWVSSYADSFGYGYWDPDQYTGASVVPHQPHQDY